MVEIKIVKKTIVAVKDKDFNEYGDIIFHDREGNEYKIGVKRAHLDKKLIVGRAVQLHWGHFHVDFIADVMLVEEGLPEPKEPYAPDEKAAAELHKEAEAKAEPKKYAPQEIGMWFKSLGDRIGDGSIEKEYPKAHVKIKAQYYKKMSEVTGVAFQ